MGPGLNMGLADDVDSDFEGLGSVKCVISSSNKRETCGLLTELIRIDLSRNRSTPRSNLR